MALSPSTRRTLLLAALIAWAVFLLDITLIHFPAGRSIVSLVPFRTIADDLRKGGKGLVVNFIGNVVAFMPLGAIPPLLWPRRARFGPVVLGGFLFSLLIEVGQYLFAHRVSDVDDLILNTGGAALGWLLATRGMNARRAGFSLPSGDQPGEAG